MTDQSKDKQKPFANKEGESTAQPASEERLAEVSGYITSTIKFLAHGLLNEGIKVDRSVITSAIIDAAFVVAISLCGAGNERSTVGEIKKIFTARLGLVEKGIDDGTIKGYSRGGFER